MPRGGIKGNKGGVKGRSGRKSKAEELGLQALLDKCWTVKDRQTCITKLAKEANNPLSSDRMEAVKLLMGYAYGKPKESKDLTTNGKDLSFTLTINNAGSSSDTDQI